ncbi:MAG: DUF1097 domain-containing protein [Desulfitobacteriaceae bacterium]|nr:DUF1097 domain-containing protein [Desulfitobacteriaceae bacterium]MDD4753786.1 DUF1097 domain-containing protein [Desulfitobacteriaceae bacterium]
MGKKTTLLALWCSLLCIVYFGLYRGFIYQIFGTDGNEAFIAFCALALFLGQNGNLKTLPNFLCSGVCGAIWGWVFLMGVGFLMPIFNGSFLPAALVDIFVFTSLAIIVHTFILRNTVFNNMAYVFMGVATTFSGMVAPGLLGVAQIAFLLICGMLIGTGTNEMGAKIFGAPTE